MRAIFTIQHPAHVHLFRNAIDELEAEGHNVFVYTREKDIAIQLLELYEIPHTILAGKSESIAGLAFRQAEYELRLLNQARRIDPDVMVAMSEPGVAHASKVLRCPSILFTDTEYAWLQNTLAFPFADQVCTPSCYQTDHGSNHVRYPGYHELAYLHPNRFTPDSSVLDEVGLSEDDSFTILRLNAFNAAHFVGDAGFDDIHEVISELEEAGTEVIITSEPDLPESVAQYETEVPLDDMHDLLYYADLLIGESATMAAESAVLGTPAIFTSTSRRGYTDELEDRYGLVYTFSGADRQAASINKGVSILETDQEQWVERREQLLEDKIDTTEFMLEQIKAAVAGTLSPVTSPPVRKSVSTSD